MLLSFPSILIFPHFLSHKFNLISAHKFPEILTFHEIYFSADKCVSFISGLTTKKPMNYGKITKQEKCLQRKTEMRSCNHCYRGKAMNITYSESVSVALIIQHAPYCRLWPVRPYNIFPHYLINGTIFEKKKSLNIKCVLISSATFYLKHFPF